ncbi:hypothetical protein [Sorangium sp. So ce131]|uniref:hypothetical protein n=1 Tax=Sorangium sp. So ce131 TaxID=3133282 RepID=UPI003F5ECDEA
MKDLMRMNLPELEEVVQTGRGAYLLASLICSAAGGGRYDARLVRAALSPLLECAHDTGRPRVGQQHIQPFAGPARLQLVASISGITSSSFSTTTLASSLSNSALACKGSSSVV